MQSISLFPVDTSMITMNISQRLKILHTHIDRPNEIENLGFQNEGLVTDPSIIFFYCFLREFTEMSVDELGIYLQVHTIVTIINELQRTVY